MREIRKGFSNQTLAFRKLPFQKLVQEICKNEEKQRQKDIQEMVEDGMLPAGTQYEQERPKIRFTKQALTLLQRSAESKLLALFEDAYMCTLHAKRVTLYNKDVRLAKLLTKEYGPT